MRINKAKSVNTSNRIMLIFIDRNLFTGEVRFSPVRLAEGSKLGRTNDESEIGGSCDEVTSGFRGSPTNPAFSSSGLAQCPQNLNCEGFIKPQLGHLLPRGAAHSPQNFPDSGFSKLQLVQIIIPLQQHYNPQSMIMPKPLQPT